MKRILCPLLLCLFLGVVLAAEVRVTNASSKPHWPWDGRIDVTYSLECDIQDAKMSVSFVGYDNVRQKEVPMTTLSGDGVGETLPAGGPYTTTWEFTTDYPKGHHSDLVVRMEAQIASFALVVDGVSRQKLPGETVAVTAEVKENKTFGGWWNISGITGIENAKTISFTMPANDVSLDSYYYDNGEYLVVNLETGENRVSNTPPDLSDDTCRTTELWLRRIPKGTFTMGSPEDEVGRVYDETQHQVTLTQDYYIGVFEMTQRQYELITGSKPSYFRNASYYATRPVEYVFYDMIRGSSAGAGWPANNNIDSDSFLGKLRTKTNLTFDLPTEAQWEYACRAGTTTSLNTGKNVVNPTSEDANLNEAGRNRYNGGEEGLNNSSCDTTGGTAKVGSYLPNAWGLYDMHGNVWELCLDWYGTYSGDAVDPAGAQSGSIRVIRGGGWYYYVPRFFRSASRNYFGPHSFYDHVYIGFRVVCLPYYHTVSVDGEMFIKKVGETFSVTAGEKEGKTFTGWTVTGVTIEDATANPLEITMPASNVTLTPNYSVNSYFLTVNGKAEQVPYGEEVSVTAEEKENKTFGGWWNISGITDIENAKTISFTMPANDVSLDSYYYDNGEYLVVNLETGENRVSNTPPDLSDDTCRTTELWLRRISKGTFTMGSPEDEVRRDTDETQHQVTLTQDYYIGVFEMTQRQYELVTGEKPSYFDNATYYATRPVEQVSYDMIRGSSAGAGWPSNNNVDSDSFLGKLRSKTELAFDLPTEAQWEYACRAGTTTSLNTGKNVVNPTSGEDANLNEAARNPYNGVSGYSQTCDTSAGTAKVGSYLPNAWGLYDMHGNVYEWCLDWYGAYSGSATDPAGAQSGSYRVLRGGSWNDGPQYFRSASRHYVNPSGGRDLGLRVVCLPYYHTMSVDGEMFIKKAGETFSVTAGEKEGKTFTGWTVTGVTIEDATANPLEITMPASNVTLTPNYSVNSYTLTVDGKAEQVPFGTAIEKTAPAKTGKTFVGWTVQGIWLDSYAPQALTFPMPSGDVTMTSNYVETSTLYLVVYLEDNAKAGVKAGDVRYTDTAPDLSDDTCRTTELWLRRIPKGTFTMGSPEDEVGRVYDETQHQVTLTQDYYIGVFEMTQRQYELITGERPSYFDNATYYATRPVERVSYNMIRGASAGAGWPANNNVDSDSFLGKLRSLTGLAFDLPTEAQWEYACRAGTTTSLNTGKNVVNPTSADANLNEAGRNWHNGGSGYSQTCDTSAGTAKVGSYLPNAWGLYDMHGNVYEWCLDWYGSYSGDATDPAGAQSGSIRVLRGGSWYGGDPRYDRSAGRNGPNYPSSDSTATGSALSVCPSSMALPVAEPVFSRSEFSSSSSPLRPASGSVRARRSRERGGERRRNDGPRGIFRFPG